jgi:hypothetical protein
VRRVKIFRDLHEAIQDALAYERGENRGVRVPVIPKPAPLRESGKLGGRPEKNGRKSTRSLQP